MAVRSDVVANAFIICICACFMLGHRTDALISMSKTCELYSEGYIADPSDCAAWGYCRGGVVAARGHCPTGFLYDSRSGECNYANITECIVSKADMCKGENAVLKADPDNCSNYCYCNNSRTETGKCPDNQYYNPNTQSCVWAITFTECMAESSCRLVPNNGFVALINPPSCSSFGRCVDHFGLPGTCAAGYVFNPSNGKCDKFTTMQCPDKPIENIPGTTPPDFAIVCKNFVASSGIQYVADGVSCSGYVACSAVGEGVWQQCPWATHYDPIKNKCVTPYDVDCQQNRCLNIKMNFMAAYGTECTEFVRCDGQLSASQPQSCADVDPNYPYFAENIGGCVKDKPTNQKICNPVVT